MFAFLEKLKADLFAKSDHPAVPPADAHAAAKAPEPPPATATTPAADPAHPVNPAVAELGHLVQLFNPFSQDAAAPAPGAPAPAVTPDKDQLIKNAMALKSAGLSDAEVLAHIDPAMRADIAQAMQGHESEIEKVAHETRDVKPGGEFQEEKLSHIKDPEQRSEVRAEIVAEELIAGTQGKFNQATVVAALEKIENPEERKVALEKFQERTGENLDAVVAKNLDKDRYAATAVEQLLSPSRDDAQRKLDAMPPKELDETMEKARKEARDIGAAIFRKSKDNKALFKLLSDKNKPEEIEALRRAFNEVYPGQDGLFNSLNWAESGDDEREALAHLNEDPQAKLKASAAALSNAFTDFGHVNDRGKMKDILASLTKPELDAMKANPEYADILNKVAGTMNGMDALIVKAYLAGDKALGDGMQIAEDVGSDSLEAMGKGPVEICGKKDTEALFAKLEKMPFAERQAAVAAYDKAAGKDGTSLEDMMSDRFHKYNTLRGQSLLKGTEEGDLDAKAAEFEDAVVFRGTDTKELEEALGDPDLALRESTDKDEQERYKAAKKRRDYIEAKIASFGEGKGSMQAQIDDENKEEEGTVDRTALDMVLKDGKISKGMELKRLIDDDNTGKAKELMLSWTPAERDEARRLFGANQEKWGTLDFAVQKEWGPKVSAGGIEVMDVREGAEESSDYYEMKKGLQLGGRQGWSPATLMEVDQKVHDDDREYTTDELLDKTRAGRIEDQELAVERRGFNAGETGEEFNQKAENTAAAHENSVKQKEDDAESFVKSLKLVATICTAILAPELLPLVGPLMSAIAISYKEHKLGQHYEGENEEKKDLGWEVVESIVTIGISGAVELKEMAAIKKAEAEIAQAKGLLKEAEDARGLASFYEEGAQAQLAREAKTAERATAAGAAHVAEDDPEALQFLKDQKELTDPNYDAINAGKLKSEFGAAGKGAAQTTEGGAVASGVADVQATTRDAETALKDTAAASGRTDAAAADLENTQGELNKAATTDAPVENQSMAEKGALDQEKYMATKEAEIKSAQQAAKVQKLAATATANVVVTGTKGAIDGKSADEILKGIGVELLATGAAELGGALMEKVLGKTKTFATAEERELAEAEEREAARAAEAATAKKAADDQAAATYWDRHPESADEFGMNKPPATPAAAASADAAAAPGATPVEKMKADVDATIGAHPGGNPEDKIDPKIAAAKPRVDGEPHEPLDAAPGEKVTPQEKADAQAKLDGDKSLKPDEQVVAATKAAGVDPAAAISTGDAVPLPPSASVEAFREWSVNAMRSILIGFGKKGAEESIKQAAGEGTPFDELLREFIEEMGETHHEAAEEIHSEQQIHDSLNAPVA